MKVAVIGCGSIGRRHIGILLGLGLGADNITAVDTSVRSFDGLPDGLRGLVLRPDDAVDADTLDVDAVMICTPADTHASYLRWAIAAGRPFFVEKPATLGTSELTADEWATRVPHVVGYQLRWHPVVQAWKALGPLRTGMFVVRCDMDRWPGRRYADAVWECSHEIDLALHLFGPASSVKPSNVGGYPYSIALEHAEGRTSTVVINPHAIDYMRNWYVTHDQSWALTFSATAPAALQGDTYTQEVRHFLDVARFNRVSQCTLEAARRVAAICELQRKVVPA